MLDQTHRYVEMYRIHDMGMGNRYIANWQNNIYSFVFLDDLNYKQKLSIDKFNQTLCSI